MLHRVMDSLGLEVVGIARSGAGAIPLILLVKPDLVLVDLSMPDQNGFGVVEELRQNKATCRFLAFTGVMNAHAIERLVEMRFDGMVSKTSGIQELVEGVQAVLAGRTYICRLFNRARSEQKGCSNHPSRFLTQREVEVLSLIGEAKSDEDIAGVLRLSAASVQGYRTKLLHKLGLHGSPQLVRYAGEHGYTEFARRRAQPNS